MRMLNTTIVFTTFEKINNAINSKVDLFNRDIIFEKIHLTDHFLTIFI